MTSKARAKGNRSRRNAIKLLESEGFEVDVVEKTSRFAKQKDMFGIFDLVAISRDRTLFVQISTNTPHPHYNFVDFAVKYPQIEVQQWVWKDRKGFEVFSYGEGEYKKEMLF